MKARRVDHTHRDAASELIGRLSTQPPRSRLNDAASRLRMDVERFIHSSPRARAYVHDTGRDRRRWWIDRRPSQESPHPRSRYGAGTIGLLVHALTCMDPRPSTASLGAIAMALDGDLDGAAEFASSALVRMPQDQDIALLSQTAGLFAELRGDLVTAACFYADASESAVPQYRMNALLSRCIVALESGSEGWIASRDSLLRENQATLSALLESVLRTRSIRHGEAYGARIARKLDRIGIRPTSAFVDSSSEATS